MKTLKHLLLGALLCFVVVTAIITNWHNQKTDVLMSPNDITKIHEDNLKNSPFKESLLLDKEQRKDKREGTKIGLDIAKELDKGGS